MEQGKDRLMSTAEAADRLGVSPRTIARWIKAGELRGVRLGRRLFRVPESEVLRIIAETYEREDEELDPRDILDGVEHTLYIERGRRSSPRRSTKNMARGLETGWSWPPRCGIEEERKRSTWPSFWSKRTGTWAEPPTGRG